MRALILDRTATPELLEQALRIAELPDPVPAPGQIRVKVEAAGLNPTDYQRAQYGMPEWQWPAVLGLDVVGAVDTVGLGVTGLRPGQRVAYVGDIRDRGGFAEFALADASAVAIVPDEVDSISAAAMPSAGTTAYQAIVRRLHVERGDSVLITGGAGGVGGFAVQLAALAGAFVLATEDARNIDHVLGLGADGVIDYRNENIHERVLALTGGRGVDAVLDTISADSATANLTLLTHGGGLASVAGRPDLTTVPPFRMAPSVHEIALGAAYMVNDVRAVQELSRMLTELLRLVADGRLSAMVEQVIGLDEVPAALVALAGRQVRGKIVMSFG